MKQGTERGSGKAVPSSASSAKDQAGIHGEPACSPSARRVRRLTGIHSYFICLVIARAGEFAFARGLHNCVYGAHAKGGVSEGGVHTCPSI